MEIIILGSGTSTGVPQPCCHCEVCTSADPRDNRLRASVLIKVNGEDILIDCGPDFRQQMLRSHTEHLSALLLTHIHYDHAGGIDDLRPFSANGAFATYTEKRVADILMSKFDYIFVNKYPGVPNIDLHIIDPDEPFHVGNVEIVPIRMLHGALPILGYRIGPFAYLTDCTYIGPHEMKKLEGIDTLVLDALRFTPHPTHMNVEQALEVVNQLKPKNTYFTHLSHQIGLHAVVDKQLPEGVHLAYDGQIIDVKD